MNLVGGAETGHHPSEKGMKRKNKNKKVQHAGPNQTKKYKTDKSQVEYYYYKK